MDNNRVVLYIEKLEKLLKKGEGHFIIFEDSETNKFVQFLASAEAKQLLLDIPTKEQNLSNKQINQLNDIMRYKNEIAEILSKENPFQASFMDSVAFVAKLVEEIFLNIFNSCSSYQVITTFDSFY